jgi:hypothetical protein
VRIKPFSRVVVDSYWYPTTANVLRDLIEFLLRDSNISPGYRICGCYSRFVYFTHNNPFTLRYAAADEGPVGLPERLSGKGLRKIHHDMLAGNGAMISHSGALR